MKQQLDRVKILNKINKRLKDKRKKNNPENINKDKKQRDGLDDFYDNY